MYDIDKILDQWKKDSVIDKKDLEQTTITTSLLHSKYLEYLSNSRIYLKSLEAEEQILLKNKWLYYNGKMTKQQMDELGWSYDPLNGLKVLKGEMDYYYNSDKDIQKMTARIEYTKNIIATLDEIINNIRWRHSSIKNIIELRKFEAGM